MSRVRFISLSLIAFWLLSNTSPAKGQSGGVSLPIQDRSGGGSPLAISGSVNLSESISGNNVRISITDDILSRNISEKTILTMVVWIDVTPSYASPQRFVRQYECFFAPDVIRPGDDHSLSQPGRGQREDVEPFDPGGASRQPLAEVRVVYVEFLDGTLFGNKELGRNIRNLRKISWHHLKDLARTFEARGEAEFLAALNEPVDPPEVDHFIANVRQTQRTRGTASAVGQIRGMLNFAEQRKIALKAKD